MAVKVVRTSEQRRGGRSLCRIRQLRSATVWRNQAFRDSLKSCPKAPDFVTHLARLRSRSGPFSSDKPSCRNRSMGLQQWAGTDCLCCSPKSLASANAVSVSRQSGSFARSSAMLARRKLAGNSPTIMTGNSQAMTGLFATFDLRQVVRMSPSSDLRAGIGSANSKSEETLDIVELGSRQCIQP